MKLVLLRHATRSPYESGDAQLTTFGLSQAEKLATMIAPQGPLPQPTHLISSPKKRALQTLSPLSQATGLSLAIDPRLDERKNIETLEEFEARIDAVFRDCSAKDTSDREACIYLCTHLDWLESALSIFSSDLSDIDAARGFSPCEYLVFKVEGGMCYSKARGIASGK